MRTSAEMDGREFDGARIVVQHGRGHRPNGPKFTSRRTDHRVIVEGLDSRTSWQDLKVGRSVDPCEISSTSHLRWYRLQLL